MAKYTFENLIINPETPGLESLIGKEVYYSNEPLICIKNANENFSVGTFEYVRKCEFSPFFVNTSVGCILNYNCIIPKKDLSPKYAEFKNLDEFSRAYDESCKHVKSDSIGGRLIKAGGVWLIREKTKTNSFYQVGYLYNNGLKVLGWGDVDWEDLFNAFTFLDKSPCGKKL